MKRNIIVLTPFKIDSLNSLGTSFDGPHQQFIEKSPQNFIIIKPTELNQM